MIRTAIIYALMLIALAIAVNSQTANNGKNVMWEPVDIPSRDLFAGPGGESMKPDLSRVEFLEEEKSGHNKKYRIKDGSGKIWVANLDVKQDRKSLLSGCCTASGTRPR